MQLQIEGLEAERFLVPLFYLKEVNIDYYEIRKAIRDYELFLYSIGGFDTDGKSKLSKISANFEDIICDYIQAIEELKKVRNCTKRACAYYDAIGYLQRQIADELHINQSTVSRNLGWLEKFFSKECIKK